MARRGTNESVGILPVDALHAPCEYDKYFTGNNTTMLVLNEKTRQLRLIPINHDGHKLTSFNIIETTVKNFRDYDTFIAVQISTPVVEDGVFCGNGQLKYVKLLQGVTTIGDDAFDTTGIRNIIIPSSVNVIGTGVFHNSKLVSIAIPPIKTISSSMFNSCYKLVTAKISEGVERIDNKAFFHCKSLKYMDIPSSVKSIGIAAFEFCSNLVAIRLHTGLIEIGKTAFLGCSSLKVFVIPASVTSIGNNVFGWCEELMFIVNLSTVKLSPETHGFSFDANVLGSFDELYNHAPRLYHLYFGESKTRAQAALALCEKTMPDELTEHIIGMVGTWGPDRIVL